MIPKYAAELFKLNDFTNEIKAQAQKAINQASVNTSYLAEIQIPLPPLAIQQQIVAECEAIDKAVSEAQARIGVAREEIEAQAIHFQGKYPEKKLSEIAQINPSKTEIRELKEDTLISFVEMASVSDKGFIAQKVDKPLKELKKGSYTYFAENDIIIAKITPCMENGKCALATGLTNGLAMGSSEFHVFRAKKEISPKFLFLLLNREAVRKEAESNFTGSSGHRRVPASFYDSYKIPVPPLSEQAALVAAVEQQEAIITAAQAVIASAASQKQAVMQAYL